MFFGVGGVADITEPPPRSLKILWEGGHSGNNVIFELNENIFEVTLPGGIRNSASIIYSEEIFDDALLDDFVNRIPHFQPQSSHNRSPNYVREALDRGYVELSEKQLNNIWQLIDDIVEGGVSREFRVPSLVYSPSGRQYVWAIIDDNLYWSLYYSNLEEAFDDSDFFTRFYLNLYINNELLHLTHEFFNLSPITTNWIPPDLRAMIEAEDVARENARIEFRSGFDETSIQFPAILTDERIDTPVMTFAAGARTSFAIQPDGSLWKWGRDSDMSEHSWWWQHDSNRPAYSNPIKIMENVTAISAGGSSGLGTLFTMTIKADNSLWAWGYNESGQLGDGTTRNRWDSPIKIMEDVTTISTGGHHTMAIKNDGSLWGWGLNESGQLGNGRRTNQRSPVKIMEDVAAVSAGDFYTMAIRTDGSLWAWGNNRHGSLGDGTIVEERLYPVKIMENVSAISAGSSLTMAIQSDGSLWAWGGNSDGQLGIGERNHFENPLPVKVMENVAAVAVGNVHAAAIKKDGSLWAWGRNTWGLVGDGTTIDRHSPVRIMDDVVSISLGESHTLAIRGDGSLWGWGIGSRGQLGGDIPQQWPSSAVTQLYPIKMMDTVMIPLAWR